MSWERHPKLPVRQGPVTRDDWPGSFGGPAWPVGGGAEARFLEPAVQEDFLQPGAFGTRAVQGARTRHVGRGAPGTWRGDLRTAFLTLVRFYLIEILKGTGGQGLPCRLDGTGLDFKDLRDDITLCHAWILLDPEASKPTYADPFKSLGEI